MVGASAAGVSAATTLRREGFDGALTLVGDETHVPYDRPPLSKEILTSDELDPDRFRLPVPDSVDLRLGVRASGLDLRRRIVALDDGRELGFSRLLIATGVRPRTLASREHARGVHVLRSLDDATALRTGLRSAQNLVVIGAGLVGCEVAAAGRALGRSVVLSDALELPMLRQVGPEVAELVLQLHQAHGVQVRMGSGVRSVEQQDGQAIGVSYVDDHHEAADCVLVAIGSSPNTEWLEDVPGLEVDNGVRCDEHCLAAPGVAAAGDVASWFHPGLGRQVRIEHRLHATEQGAWAARSLLGMDKPFTPVPYFWTDQYDVKIQVFGSIDPNAKMVVVEGSVEQRKFVAEYSRNGVVEAVLGWNSARDVVRRRSRVGADV